MHKRFIATETNLDILIHIAVSYVLVQKSRESVKWTAQVANINEYVRVNAAESGNYSGSMLRFFSEKKINAEIFSPKY